MAKISCPVCQQSDQVFKVSQIYVEGISKEPVADSNLIATVLNYPPEKKWTGFPSAGEQKFLKMFAPPSGSTAITRPSIRILWFALSPLWLYL
jgi:hypothetical protein